MTEVDFYVAGNDSDDARLRVACRLCDQAMQRSQHVFVNAASETDAGTLDELLWTLIQGSFIPHKVVRGTPDAAPIEPVLIGVQQQPLGKRWDLLINLAPDVPEFFSRYERVAEIVDGNTARREQSRERYRFYRDRGYKLNTHQV
ncbi:MAG TPA: DNA polymerase III subunit chi [Gammaproteobacteria bacterium]|nr:DNA polymerase III subunit chi [Gammaproteobacteria bacterium]